MQSSNQLAYTCWENSPLGPIFMLARKQKLCRIVINQRTENCLDKLQDKYQQELIEDKSFFAIPIAQLHEYFENKRQKFDLELDLDPATDFQKRVWQVLNTIPYGQVRSYKWAAAKVGVPKGARAVGAANRCNPLPIVIPCHRIINANGALGGYSGGGEIIKQKLLELEGATLACG